MLDLCLCPKRHIDVKWNQKKKYNVTPKFYDWNQNPFIWLHYVESSDGLQPKDDVLRSTDSRYWSIHDVQRYFCGDLHCEQVLFPCQYPNLRMPTHLGNFAWRFYTALKKPSQLYLKEFHRSLELTLKKMELEEAQIDRLILCDELINVRFMDYFKRKTFFRSLLNILSFQDDLQLVSFENLRCTRLEGVRLIQQLACFNSHSLKYLYLWQFVQPDENPMLVNYNYITGSGEYIPRPTTSQCFVRSLGQLQNLRVLAVEYAHLADGTGTALISLLTVIKRPHFRLQVPGRGDPSLGVGGLSIPEQAWRRVNMACPDLYLLMVFHRVRKYEGLRRFLSGSAPLCEVHVQCASLLPPKLTHSDLDCLLHRLAFYHSSTLRTVSIQDWRSQPLSLRRIVELFPLLAHLQFTGRVRDCDLRDVLIVVACGQCSKLKKIDIKIQDDELSREYWNTVVNNLNKEFSDIMKLFDINFCLSIYKC